MCFVGMRCALESCQAGYGTAGKKVRLYRQTALLKKVVFTSEQTA
jgi:hypothetical protein